MKYIISKNNNDKKLTYYNVKITGLEVKPINEAKNQNFEVQRVLLVDDKLQDSYIKQRINRKLDKIIKFMLQILNEDDTNEDDSSMVIDEINRLKGIIINKYRKYMKDQEYKAILAKLILIEEEFKRNYNEKLFMTYSNNYIEEEMTAGKSR